MGQVGKRFSGPVIIGVVIALIAGLVILNRWIQKKADGIAEHPLDTSTIQPLSPPPQPAEKPVPPRRTGEVIRKTRLAPERTYATSVFYQGGVEIARHKVSNGTVYDQTGEIPDGKVKFVNESEETYGMEYYRDGKRHGPSQTNYKDGRLKQKAYYQYGKLVTGTEYYSDGSVRMEEDYTDARDYNDKRDVGAGKVYFRDGTLKYEWRLTNSEPVGFHKSYNRKGELVAAVYYDEHGDVIRPKGEADAGSAAREGDL